MDQAPVGPGERFGELLRIADDIADTAESLGVPYATLELIFDRLERWHVTYEDGHVRLREWRRGTEVSWMPSARRRFEKEAQTQDV